MRPSHILALIASHSTLCAADVEFTSPAAGAVINPTDLVIKWKDSGDAPALSDLVSYEIDLLAGGNTNDDAGLIAVLVPQGTVFSINSAEAAISPIVGGDDKNAYYLRFTSTAASGAQVINFSPRFTLKGMTGVFSAAVIQGIATITSTAARARINNIGDTDSTADSTDTVVPYGEQTGLTRYAPMMKKPPKSITKKDTKPLFPTSSVKIATKPIPSDEAASITVTAKPVGWPAQSENEAKPASHPNPDMQKYLKRWKD